MLSVRTAGAALLMLWAGVCLAAGTGGGMSAPLPQAQAKTPEQLADGAYRSGLKQKKRAWKQEEKAEKAKNEAARNKALARAQKAYVKAAKYHGTALHHNPQHYEAANEMGYALRKSGEFEQAIKAYSYALRLKPDFYEAVEYRGEAWLSLGEYDQVKTAYMTLFRNAPELAVQLMAAMEQWLDHRKPVAGAEDFAVWVQERRALAEVSQNLTSGNLRSW